MQPTFSKEGSLDKGPEATGFEVSSKIQNEYILYHGHNLQHKHQSPQHPPKEEGRNLDFEDFDNLASASDVQLLNCNDASNKCDGTQLLPLESKILDSKIHCNCNSSNSNNNSVFENKSDSSTTTSQAIGNEIVKINTSEGIVVEVELETARLFTAIRKKLRQNGSLSRFT